MATEPFLVYEPGCLHGISFFRSCEQCGRVGDTDEIARLRKEASECSDQWRVADKQTDQMQAAIARLRVALAAVRPYVVASTAPNAVLADLDAALAPEPPR
jgi:hypothetical protein